MSLKQLINDFLEVERQLKKQYGIATVINSYIDGQVEALVLYEDDFFELAGNRMINREKNDVYSCLYFYIDNIKVKYIFDSEDVNK